jgi:YfiH family protein
MDVRDGSPTGIPRMIATAQAPYEEIDAFADLGVRALVTTRAAGDLGLAGAGPVGAVLDRWTALRTALGQGTPVARLASAGQVHGARIIEHETGWEGWLRADAADGHFSRRRGIALAVTVADCVPVFLAHASGAVALLHAGWRGTAAGIVPHAITLFASHGLAPTEIRVYLGPAICGSCYQVSADVYAQVTGRTVGPTTPLDLRAVLTEQSRAAGVRDVSTSAWCTRCDAERFFSHRGGDAGRHVAVILAA